MKEYDTVKINENYEGIKVGTTGIVVHKYDDTMVEVEFVDKNNETIDVVTTPINKLELL